MDSYEETTEEHYRNASSFIFAFYVFALCMIMMYFILGIWIKMQMSEMTFWEAFKSIIIWQPYSRVRKVINLIKNFLNSQKNYDQV
ncbi:unnamed protein product [Blepharisma stoltei]|uniref:Uncharacterized protein n=1 Tax=Blepharisma stoltei TaxID=1481888 RepID=A0AAU9KCU9_9CILI|nr:unnamed protein product [Blepharisma stoltei]